MSVCARGKERREDGCVAVFGEFRPGLTEHVLTKRLIWVWHDTTATMSKQAGGVESKGMRSVKGCRAASARALEGEGEGGVP